MANITLGKIDRESVSLSKLMKVFPNDLACKWFKVKLWLAGVSKRLRYTNPIS